MISIALLALFPVRAAAARAARVATDAYLDRARKEATSTVIDLVGEEICDLIGEAARKAAIAAIQAAFDEYENHEYEKLGRRPADEDATN